MGRQRPEAHRGPSCSVCRNGRVRILVISPRDGDPDYGIRACPACDRVELAEPAGGSELRTTIPLRSASKIRR